MGGKLGFSNQGVQMGNPKIVVVPFYGREDEMFITIISIHVFLNILNMHGIKGKYQRLMFRFGIVFW